MTSAGLLKMLTSSQADAVLEPVYGPDGGASRWRYKGLLRGLQDFDRAGFPEAAFLEADSEVRAFSAAGRTELGGNHTDHNLGKVIAAAVQFDIAAVVAPRTDKKVFFRSAGFPDVAVDLADLSARPEETGSTAALVRGVAAEFEKRGVSVSGWSACADSTVPPGSGLSSSAAVEVLFGKIFDCLCADGKRSALEIAQIGQIAENTYFGKPSGLMDQTACASGGAVAIDFHDADRPLVRQINFDTFSCGYAPVIVNTGGSHAGLTPDYAAIPAEMRSVAKVFAQETLAGTTLLEIMHNIPKIRTECGDRALIRAIHFHNENKRVDLMYGLMRKIDAERDFSAKAAYFQEYLALVNESGHSSWELLQNMYSPAHKDAQALCAGLAITREFLGNGGAAAETSSSACRIHGGGFAGAIQAYIPLERIAEYCGFMDAIFGQGATTVLKIRPVGAAEVVF
jgi:galactokinase